MAWEVFDKFYNAHWFLTGYSCRNFSELLRDGGNRSITTFIGVMEHDVNWMIFDTKEFNQAANYYAHKLINDRQWRKTMYKKHDRALKEFFVFGERLLRIDLTSATDKQLVTLVRKGTKLQEQVRILGVMLNGLVLDGRNHFSDMLRAELKQIIKNDNNFEKHWTLLSQTTTISWRQQKQLAIARLAKQRTRLSSKEVDRRLRALYHRYCWLDYMYYGPPATFESFQEDLRQAEKKNTYLSIHKHLTDIAHQQKAIMKSLRFNTRARHLVRLAQLVLWKKGRRKDVEYHGFYCYEPLLREIAKRKNEKDWKNLLYMFPWELEEFIQLNRPSLYELYQRRSFSCLVVTWPKKVKMLVGQSAQKFVRSLKLDVQEKEIKEVKGQCAFAGKAIGKARLVFTPADMVKMKEGDILISQATSPDLIAAMKKAGAIVTNTGGLICHAAITSRELKVPCIVGTVNATLMVKDGDLVEVDATNGIMKKIIQ